MLMDILGIVIALSVVMLLLSLIVTSLGQVTQATLRLRARNLRYGLATALNHEVEKPDAKSLLEASSILNASDGAALRRLSNPTGLMARILVPRVSWMDAEGLRVAMNAITPMDENDKPKQGKSDIEKTVAYFEKLDKPLRKRFESMMRGVSLFWALVVAAIFQVSTPALIQQLSIDPVLRAQYMAAAPGVMEVASRQIESSQDYADIYQDALATLQQRHPELGDIIATLDTASEYPEGLAEQLSETIEDNDSRALIVAELEALLQAGLIKQRDLALANTREVAGQLSVLNITPLRHGWEFFTAKDVAVQNWLGILITTILLTLGAPFWFDTLKNAVAWRDLFAKPPPAATSQPSKGKES